MIPRKINSIIKFSRVWCYSLKSECACWNESVFKPNQENNQCFVDRMAALCIGETKIRDKTNEGD